jgi:hypothetical protein
MVLAKILGFVDIIASLVLLMSGFMPSNIIVAFGIYLIIKGVLFNIFGLNIVSAIDLAIGLFMVFGIAAGFSINFFRVLFFVFLVQKGIFSLF